MPLDLSIAFRTRPRFGEDASGDRPILRREDTTVLYGVIDALGHGVRAQEAAVRAATFLSGVALGWDLTRIMQGLHESLRGSRGAAATLLLFRDGELFGSAVGNVALRAVGTTLPLVPVPGILGSRLDAPRVFRKPMARGDRHIIFSDGVAARGLRMEAMTHMTPDELASYLIADHGVDHDDATVLVADAIAVTANLRPRSASS